MKNQEEIQVNIDEVVGETPVSRRQSEITQYTVKESKAFHFVSTCNWDFPDLKGVTSKFDQEKPYLMVKELGKEGGSEHHHLYFHSPKSLNTVKKYLTEHGFLNLKYTDPNNPRYKKYDECREFKDLVGYKNLGCILYLLKGKTNHFICKDDLNVKPEISDSNIEDLTVGRDLYETIIREMREKRDILIQEKVDSKEKKKEIELFTFFTYIEDCTCHSQLPDYIGDFFVNHSDIVHSDHKGFSFYKAALKKFYPKEYREFCKRSVLKKLKQLTEL